LPPAARLALADLTAPLLITEGEKKALAADQAGFPCVGLVGVYGWCKKRAKGDSDTWELIDALAPVATQGRPIAIVFDSDAATNDKIVWAELHLSETLEARGALVKVARLPQGEP